MIRWTVTGPVGAGKSSLTRLLAERGAAILDGDRLGHEVLARPEVAAAVGEQFGHEYVAGGVVDRRRLGQLVFADPASLVLLNQLTHGPLAELVADRLEALEKSGEHVLAVFEAAVYFLLPSPPRMDLVVVVNADPEIRVRRLATRPGLDTETARSRAAAQKTMEPLWKQGDIVFDNSGDKAALARFAAELWDRLPSDRSPT